MRSRTGVLLLGLLSATACSLIIGDLDVPVGQGAHATVDGGSDAGDEEDLPPTGAADSAPQDQAAGMSDQAPADGGSAGAG